MRKWKYLTNKLGEPDNSTPSQVVKKSKFPYIVKGVGFKPLFLVAFSRGQYYHICQRGHCNSKTNYQRKGEPIQKPNEVVWHKTSQPLFLGFFLKA